MAMTPSAGIFEGQSPISLPALVTFESVARHASFAKAATELNVSPTAISKTIKHLEAQLGARLFNRTTRSVGLTESGNVLLETLRPALEMINTSVRLIGESSAGPNGTLRITTSNTAYHLLIEPRLAAFFERYPHVQLEFSLNNGLMNLVAGGFDVGIRLGENLEQDTVALPIGPAQRMAVVAAPQYLSRHPVPQQPVDLLQHDCIRLRFVRSSRYHDWTFDVDGRSVRIDVRGRLLLDDMHVIANSARLGHGMAYVFKQMVEQDLASGRLVQVLEKYCSPSQAFYMYCPSRHQIPGKLRAFLDFMRADPDGQPAANAT